MDAFINNILDEVSGKRAWNWVSKLSQYHRIQGSIGYHEAAQLVASEFIRLKLDEVEILEYPADGKTNSWEWDPPISWEINSGRLSLIEPEEKLLSRFNELPMSVVTHSTSCDIVAEVVDVGEGTNEQDYNDKNVKGKYVLMWGTPRGEFLDLAYDKGIAGILIYPKALRAAAYPDMVRYDGFWPTNENRQKIISGFSISYEQAIMIQEKLKNGMVKIHGQIDASLYDGKMGVVTAAIKGSEYPEKEIVIIAHLCHPAASANDNASGVGGAIEMARAIKNMIENGKCKPPKRTIRFLLVPEFNGTVAYMRENELAQKDILVCLNLDMIGEHPVRI